MVLIRNVQYFRGVQMQYFFRFSRKMTTLVICIVSVPMATKASNISKWIQVAFCGRLLECSFLLVYYSFYKKQYNSTLEAVTYMWSFGQYQSAATTLCECLMVDCTLKRKSNHSLRYWYLRLWPQVKLLYVVVMLGTEFEWPANNSGHGSHGNMTCVYSARFSFKGLQNHLNLRFDDKKYTDFSLFVP